VLVVPWCNKPFFEAGGSVTRHPLAGTRRFELTDSVHVYAARPPIRQGRKYLIIERAHGTDDFVLLVPENAVEYQILKSLFLQIVFMERDAQGIGMQKKSRGIAGCNRLLDSYNDGAQVLMTPEHQLDRCGAAVSPFERFEKDLFLAPEMPFHRLSIIIEGTIKFVQSLFGDAAFKERKQVIAMRMVGFQIATDGVHDGLHVGRVKGATSRRWQFQPERYFLPDDSVYP